MKNHFNLLSRLQSEKVEKYRPGQHNWEYTMWKSTGTSATQILREIIFGHFEALKTVI